MQVHTFRLHRLAFADGYTLLNGGAGWATKQLNVEVPASSLARSLACPLPRSLDRVPGVQKWATVGEYELLGLKNAQLSATPCSGLHLALDIQISTIQMKLNEN